MTDFDDAELSREDGHKVAIAEYVLGLGTSASRAAIARAIETDPAIATEARFWETHFSGFNDDYQPQAAPQGVFPAIEKRLFGAPSPSPMQAAWYNTLNFWRGLAGVATAAAVVAIGLNILPLTQTTQPLDTTQLVAAMQPVESDVSFVARYDADSGELRLTGSGAVAGEDSDYELWFIEGEDTPISMGVIQVGDAQSISVAEALRGELEQGITLAVTREVAGGSPTGLPQGPIVSAGPVAAI